MTLADRICNAYLDYFNNYLMIDRFADDYGLTREEAIQLIALGRSILDRTAAAARSPR